MLHLFFQYRIIIACVNIIVNRFALKIMKSGVPSRAAARENAGFAFRQKREKKVSANNHAQRAANAECRTQNFAR